MKENTEKWLRFANENIMAARLLLAGKYYNTCLQNLQQTIEKAMKAIIVEHALFFKKSHSILKINKILEEAGIHIDLSDEDCNLLDSIYLPSRYPIGSALPDFEPTEEICLHCLDIAENILSQVNKLLQ